MRPARRSQPPGRPRERFPVIRAVLAAALACAFVAAPVAAPGGLPAASAATSCDDLDHALIDETPYALKRLGARRVWERATGNGVIVAVVDSGVNARNPHFTGAVLPGTSLIPDDPDTRGWTDRTSHGTAIAGIIAARPVMGSGVVGLAPKARILPVRVFVGEEDRHVAAGVALRADRIAEGIRWAVERGARIVNVSMSTPKHDGRLDAAVAFARSRGVLVVASAGNRTQSPDKGDGPRYPAASAGALAVTAATTQDVVTDDSIHGPHVDVASPGHEVLTTFRAIGDCLIETDGASSSFATGYVSGAAALIAETYPSASPDEIAYRLMASADRPVRGQRDDVRGWGLIQPYEALTMTIDASRQGPPLPGQTAKPSTPPTRPAIDLEAARDPLDQPRRVVAWLLFGGASGLALLLLLSWTARRPQQKGPIL